jgi:putative oxidoreductase
MTDTTIAAKWSAVAPRLHSLLRIVAAFIFLQSGTLMLGLFTRPVAFLLAGEMAVAYFQYSALWSFWPVANNGVAAALYCFLWLYMSAAGPGPWSLDAKWRNRANSQIFHT